ncbi:MAG: rod shape-determining protein MreD [Cypionkella sp.]|nr:rod shape-determining protein MreD [Cypionkella sp.]
MIDPVTLTLWRGRIGFVLIAALLVFLALLPIGGDAGRWPGPDVLLCIVFAWMMRRPDYLPLWLLAGVMLLADTLLMRPVGLWAALTVIAAEVLRTRSVLMRELSFPMEWAVVAGLMLLMLLIYRFVFALTLLPQVGFGAGMVQWLWSVMAYPAVVLFTSYALALRKPSLGEIDAYGRRF